MINAFETLFEARERKFQQEKLFRGESVDLVAKITTDGVPDSLDGYAVEGYYQPVDYVGTDDEKTFYSVPAEIADGKVTVHWTYDRDFGKTAYNIWALLTKSGEQSYPVCWRLAFAHSPSYPVGEAPDPLPQTIDFSKYEVLNAPWALLSDFQDFQIEVGETYATKEEAAEISNALSGYLPLSGGTVTQTFQLKSFGRNVLSGLNGAIAIGTDSAARSFGIAIGYKAKSEADLFGGVAVGEEAKANGKYSVALGTYANAKDDNSTALGSYTAATGAKTVAVGFGAKTSNEEAIAVGYGSNANAQRAIQIGYGTNATAKSLKVFDKMILSGDNLTLDPERVPYLSGYAKKEELPVVPTDLSAFTNSPGYLTAHQSLEDYLPLSGGTVDWLSVDSVNFNVKDLLKVDAREDGKMGSLLIGSDITNNGGSGKLAPIVLGNDVATYGNTGHDVSFPNIAIGNDNIATQGAVVIGGALGRKYEYDLGTGTSEDPSVTIIFNPKRQNFGLNELVFVDENGDPVTPEMIQSDSITTYNPGGAPYYFIRKEDGSEWGAFITRKVGPILRKVWVRAEEVFGAGYLKQNALGYYYRSGSTGGNIKLKFEPDAINSIDHSAAAGFSLAIGNDTMAGGWISADVYHEWFNPGAIAIGHGSIAKDFGTIALGTGNLIEGENSIGIGFNANTSADYAIQLGTGTNSTQHSLQYEDTQIVAKTYDTSLSAWINPKLNPDLLPNDLIDENALSNALSDYYTKTEADGRYDTKTQVDNKVANSKNYLPYGDIISDATIALTPSRSVYRYTDSDGSTVILPTIGSEGIPSSDDYFCFEVEVAVPSGATLDSSTWASVTWLPGFELPQYDYAGKTLYISCRLDCQTRGVTASCWRVA